MSENQISRKIGNSSKNLPDFEIEKKYWEKGYFVVGVDEVGRGAVAGPVVAAAAATKSLKLNTKSLESLVLSIKLLGIDDSKRLTRKRREELEPVIKKYFYYGVGEAGVEEINKLGIVVATRRAMKRAVRNSKFQIPNSKQFSNIKLLIDGRRVKGIGNQVGIVKGDRKSISIAAASIIAKVYRDKLMRDLSGKYKAYGFERHVGYGTKHHELMIRKLGMCEIHRVRFVRTMMRTCLR